MASNTALILPARAPGQPVTAALTNDIRPIKPPVAVHDPWVIVAWTGGVLLGLTLLALLFWWWWKRRPAAQPVIIPPHVRARERLNAALSLLNDPRAFCIAVSDAVRVYLEERFQLRAPERTTEEFLNDLQATPHLSVEQKQSLAEFLSRCDLVKFARADLTEVALRDLHDSALRLVHETQHDPIATPANAEAAPAEPTR